MATKAPLDDQEPIFPVRIPPSVWYFAGAALVVALIEIQFAEASWHLFYGFLTGRFTSILDTANQFPEFLTIAAVGIAVWIHRPAYRSTLLSMALAIGVASLATGIVKEITGRARPTSGVRIEEHRDRLEERIEFSAEHPNSILKPKNGDYWLLRTPAAEYFSKNRPWFEGEYASFPSGHATSAFAFVVWLAILYPRGRWLWYTLAILTCVARVRFRRHHPGDVIAGAVVGYVTAWLIFASPWISRQSAALARGVEKLLGEK
ncbi:phosphatase PAP2 family protein [bacterium]|nr:phosphatase PAP2 family protein [bacterium]